MGIDEVVVKFIVEFLVVVVLEFVGEIYDLVLNNVDNVDEGVIKFGEYVFSRGEKEDVKDENGGKDGDEVMDDVFVEVLGEGVEVV